MSRYWKNAPEFNRLHVSTLVPVLTEELATLPPGALIIRLGGITSHLPEDLSGQTIYVESTEDRMESPLSEEEKKAPWRRGLRSATETP